MSTDSDMAPQRRAAIYPGSFDPLTRGHVNVIQRGLKLFDRVVVAVTEDTGKPGLFSAAERIELIRASLEQGLDMRDRLELECFSGLLVDYAAERGIDVILRGIRSVSDFEYELKMSYANRTLREGIDTVFVMTDPACAHLSSTLIKQIAELGGDVGKMVPPPVERALRRRFARAGAGA